MKKTLLYTTGKLFTDRQTGGTKRFVELLSFYAKQKESYDLCCQDSKKELEKRGFVAKYHMRSENERIRIIPAELSRLIRNYKTIKSICCTNYESIISFDVPPTIGLILMGASNVVLLLRKDMYEYNKLKRGRGLFAWLSEKCSLWAEKKCLMKAKKVFVQCYYDKNALIERHKDISDVIFEKVIVQINNVNPSWICERAMALKSIDAKNESKRVCFVGDVDGIRKGVDLFLDAAEILIEKKLELQFDVIGGGKRLEALKNSHDKNRIVFHGRMQNPMIILNKASLAVVPSRADSCPNTVMEALYLGVPVIGSKAGGIPEILLREEVLFDLTPESLAECIERIVMSAEVRKEVINFEKKRAQELSFDWASRMNELIISDSQ